MDGSTLDRLYAVIASRRDADAATSYTARLLGKGTAAIAKKVGEEAVETVIAALAGDRIVEESADLLYHLLVLWADRGIAPTAVWQALERRSGTSGLAEKVARSKTTP